MTALADKPENPPLVLRKLPDYGDDLFDDPGPALPPEGMEEPEFPNEEELKPFTMQLEPELVESHMDIAEGVLPHAAGAPKWATELSPSLMDAIELHEAGFASGIPSLDYMQVLPDGTEIPYNPNAPHVAMPIARDSGDALHLPDSAFGPTAASTPAGAPHAAPGTQSPTSASTTPVQDPAAIEAILTTAEEALVNQNTLVYEFGAFKELELRMRGITDGVLSGVSEQLVTSFVRRAFHGAATSNANLSKPANSKEGLVARIAALNEVHDMLGDSGLGLKRMLDDLQDAGVMGASTLFHDLKQAVISERNVLADQQGTLAPPTLGRLLFDKARGAAAALTDNHLVGNARQHRNGELTKALRGLYEIGAELKANAGNADWEQGQGKASLKEVQSLSKRIHGLTKGVEDQVDGLALRKGFNDVNGMLQDASAAAADQEHKNALEQMSKYITDLVKRITDALGALFNRNAGSSKRSSPTAL